MENFETLFNNHKKWVDTAGKAGKQLTLDCVDMHDIEIHAPLLEQGFFSECDFMGISFESVDFYQSEFYTCNFTGARFYGCDFRKTALDYSNFSNVTFQNCKFSRADAYKAIFDNCIFTNCSFVGFNLMESSIRGARFESTDFDGAYIDKANAVEAKIIKPINTDKINHLSICLEDSDTVIEGAFALIKLEAQN